jgi:hypothetical protein
MPLDAVLHATPTCPYNEGPCESLADLPEDLMRALSDLGDEPITTIVTWDMIQQLIALRLVEATYADGVCFTELGKRLFRELRETIPGSNV